MDLISDNSSSSSTNNYVDIGIFFDLHYNIDEDNMSTDHSRASSVVGSADTFSEDNLSEYSVNSHYSSQVDANVAETDLSEPESNIEPDVNNDYEIVENSEAPGSAVAQNVDTEVQNAQDVEIENANHVRAQEDVPNIEITNFVNRPREVENANSVEAQENVPNIETTNSVNRPTEGTGTVEIVVDIPENSSEQSVTDIVPVKIGKKRQLDDSPPSKRAKSDSEDDESSVCPICFDNWSNFGERQLSSLKCGHLFCHKCLVRWFNSYNKRTCPTCKRKAAFRDIRVIFAKKLVVLDTVQIDRLNAELDSVKLDRNRLQAEESRLKLIIKNQLSTIQKQASRIMELENKSISNGSQMGEKTSRAYFSLEKTLDICKEDGCRIMAYNNDNLLVVTLKIANHLFSGYGIKKIILNSYTSNQFLYLHSQVIRDLAFHPQTSEWLLSVSVDKTAKLINIETNSVVKSFTTEVSLWSCCWDVLDPNFFYVGSQRGTVLQYNIQEPSTPRMTISVPDDNSPVTSLVCVNSDSYLPRGAVLCCKLSSCWVFLPNGMSFIKKKILLEGPFVSLNYNSISKQILVSTRPNPRWVFCRYILCELEDNGDDTMCVNVVHSFQGGTTQKHLSRNCQIPLVDDVLISCYQETKRHINVWSVTSGELCHSLSTPDPIIDMCFIPSKNFLIALSERRVYVYNLKGR